MADLIDRTPDQVAAERIGYVAEALKQLLRAGLDEVTARKLLAENFPDFATAFAGTSDATKKQLEAAHKGCPDVTLATKSGRFAVIKAAANTHGIGATEAERVSNYLEHHTDAHAWHNMAAEGQAVIEKPPVQKAVALRTVAERALAKLDGLARAEMAKSNADYANSYDRVCMSGEGRELWELSADVYADRTLGEFRKTLVPTHQRFAGGSNEGYRQRISKRLGAL